MSTRRTPDDFAREQAAKRGTAQATSDHRSSNQGIALTQDERTEVDAARDAWGVLRKTFDHWVTLGRGIVRLRARALRMGGRNTFQRLMDENGMGELVSAKSKAIVTRLEKIMQPENLSAVQAWHNSLDPHQRIAWASPSSIVRHCPVFQAGKKPRDRKQPGAPTLLQENGALKERLTEVEQERDAFREQLATRAGPVALAEALQAQAAPLGQAGAAPPVPAASDDATKQAVEQFAAGIENLPRKRRFEILLDLFDRINMLPSDVSSAWNRRFEARGGKSAYMVIGARPTKKRK